MNSCCHGSAYDNGQSSHFPSNMPSLNFGNTNLLYCTLTLSKEITLSLIKMTMFRQLSKPIINTAMVIHNQNYLTSSDFPKINFNQYFQCISLSFVCPSLKYQCCCYSYRIAGIYCESRICKHEGISDMRSKIFPSYYINFRSAKVYWKSLQCCAYSQKLGFKNKPALRCCANS